MNEVGRLKRELDTPFLWTDLDRLEANVRSLASFFRRTGVQWRPHIKGIKVPAVARLALQAGAVGVTCAKLGEAEVMAAAGISDILIAHQVVGPLKARRLAELRRRADVKAAVDSEDNARELGQAALAAGVEIGVVAEVDIGMGRAGVAPGEPAAAFCRRLHGMPGLRFRGLMGWEGHAVSIAEPAAKRAEVEKAIGLLGETARLCREAGLPVAIVSGGGSGDYRLSAPLGVLTEVQAGGAIFCDATYRAWGADTRPSLFVRTTVTSRPAPERIIFDAGFKALPAWARPPIPVGLPAAAPYQPSAEHGTLVLDAPDAGIRVGEAFDFIVGYGDATVFLHDRLYGIRRERVETVWEVEARGRLR